MMEDESPIHADTDQALNFQELVRAFDAMTIPTQVADTPLPFDPDDYPVVVAPPETRTHRMWHYLKFAVQVIVYGVMLILILGIILIFVLIPVLIPQR